MRIIGAPDYYDGTAYCRADGVASLLVYRRGDGVMADGIARRTLRIPRRIFRGAVIGADGAIPRGRLARILGLDPTLRWGAFEMRIEPCHALFCGTVHTGLVVSTGMGRCTRRTTGGVVHCWTPDAYEEALAEHGYMAADDRHLRWFASFHRHDEAVRLGIATATCDPSDDTAGRAWRVDAATLGAVGFAELIQADVALERLARWIGTGETRIMTRGVVGHHGMMGSASGGR